MYHQIFQPPAELKSIVKNFYIIESTPGETLPQEYQSMADGCPEIIFQYNAGFKEYQHIQAYVRPQHVVHQTLKLRNTMGLFVIRLYPHAIQHLFNVASTEVINKVYDLKDMIREHWIVQSIIEATHTEKRIAVANEFLLKQSKNKSIDPIHKLVSLVMQSNGEIDTHQLRKYIGLSERQFERRFKAIAGFTPKHYARMMRFQNTKRKYVSGNFRTLSELAQICNYSDQSHFIREFKEFSGMTPAQYFRLLNNEENQECQVIKGLIIPKETYTNDAAMLSTVT